ncbi:MAG: VOC family protein [Proteobacteria bacterium]|nr:VOC family protein [Pseudomonadota bacterium]
MRVQLALNVRDIEEAVAYYAKLFGAEPNKRRPGYANFALDAPPLKLVLFENPNASERLNHLGVEVFDQTEVDVASERLAVAGIRGPVEEETTCCHAVQNKVWSEDPEGAKWEWYRVLRDAEPEVAPQPEARGCC